MHVMINCLAQIHSTPLLQSLVMLRFLQRENDISSMQLPWHAASHQQHANSNMQQLKENLLQLLGTLKSIIVCANPTDA